LDHFRNTRRRMKKTPYVELMPGAIIEVSDEDKGDMDIMSELGVDYDKNKRVKEEALTIAELNSKLEQKMKEEMAASQEESASTRRGCRRSSGPLLQRPMPSLRC
jgi:hypothetical protein